MINLLNDPDYKYTEWTFNGSSIKIEYIKTGYGVYSDYYNVIIIMEYETTGELNMNVYTADGVFYKKIAPSVEDLAYQYMSKYTNSKSGAAVVGEYEKNINGFSQWYFEIDLENFCVGKRISPAY